MIESMFLYVYDAHIFWSAADTVNSGNWFTEFKVIIFNVAILTMLLLLNNFGLGLSYKSYIYNKIWH